MSTEHLWYLIYFANKGLSSQGYGFSSSHVWMWELDHKESWVPKNWCFWTVVLEKTLERPLDCKEIQPVHPKGSQSWIFIGRTDAEAETPILWPPDAKNWLIWKDPDAGKDWRRRRRGRQKMRWLDGITDSMDMIWVGSGSWCWTGRPGVLQFMGLQRVRHDWATELNWTEPKSCFSLKCLSLVEQPQVEGCSGSSATCAVLLHMLHGFHGQSLLFRCYRGSVLDAIPPCVMASGNLKRGGGFAFCLIFMHEEAVLGPSPVCPASLYARLWAWPLPPGLGVKWQALVKAITFCLTSNSVQPPGRQQE